MIDANNTTHEMKVKDVEGIISFLEKNDIEVYVDGGWAVDALIGKQTRKHEDLDIATPHRYAVKIRRVLKELGYKEIPSPDSWECNFVLGDSFGHMIDVHTFIFNEKGENIFGVAYLPQYLVGRGVVGSIEVKCPPPDVLVEFHTGYEVDESDYMDTLALCNKFDIELPDDYMKFLAIK